MPGFQVYNPQRCQILENKHVQHCSNSTKDSTKQPRNPSKSHSHNITYNKTNHPKPNGCNYFAYSWKFPAYSGVFLVTVVFGSFLLTIAVFDLQLELFACSGKVLLISTSTDCKQRISTVSKKASTVSKKLPQTKHASHRPNLCFSHPLLVRVVQQLQCITYSGNLFQHQLKQKKHPF